MRDIVFMLIDEHGMPNWFPTMEWVHNVISYS